MDPIGDHVHPPSDSHRTGGADEGRTYNSWGGGEESAQPQAGEAGDQELAAWERRSYIM